LPLTPDPISGSRLSAMEAAHTRSVPSVPGVSTPAAATLPVRLDYAGPVHAAMYRRLGHTQRRTALI
jgi:hypothetical protein